MIVHRYSNADLLRLREEKDCICLCRVVKRRLKYFRIFVSHISVHISLRRPCRRLQPSASSRNLIVPHREGRQCRRRPRNRDFLPSLLLSNVRSLCNKMDEVEQRLSTSSPDIAVFTETWLDEDIPNNSVTVSGYSIARKDRNKFGGGIIFYVSVNFHFVIINPTSVPSLMSCDSEILPIMFPSLNLLIIGMYHPFWKNNVKHEEAISTVIDVIEYANNLPFFNGVFLKVVLCGDFNDLICHIEELEGATGLKSIVTGCTRGNRILDQIFTNVNCKESPIVSAPFGRSDHAVVSWFPQGKCFKTTKKRVRNFCPVNKFQFQRIISLIDWSLIDNFHDPDFAMSVLHVVLFFIFDSCFPWVTVRFSNKDPPWMSVPLKVLMDRRDRAFSKGRLIQYKSLRSQVIRLTAALKEKYLSKMERSCNKRDAWKGIRLMSRNQKSNCSSICTSADELNNYFASVFTQHSDPFANVDDLSTLPDHVLEVNVVMVDSYLRKLKKGDGGSSSLPFWIFRDNSLFLSRPIVGIFNKCFSLGCFPSVLKFADVIPVPKVTHPTEPTHFRPISILPVLSKVMEKIVLHEWFLPSLGHKVDPLQFAYFPGAGKGTSCALTFISHHILKFLDGKSGAVRILAADLSKAFDKLPFVSILSALVKFQLPRLAVILIKDFLCNRWQRVSFDSCSSGWSSIMSGVPQGSVIGPFLFALVIDSLSPVCGNSVMVKYADDVTILHCIRNECEDYLQQEWEHLEEWTVSVGLSLNLSKSCVMNCITKRSLNIAPVVTVSGAALNTVTSIRLLGVIFSSDLTWNEHFSYIVSKCYKRFFILRNLKRANCSSRLLHRCYAAFIQSLMLYSYPCFCNAPKYLLTKFQRVERRASWFFSDFKFHSFTTVADMICSKLFTDISRFKNHSLRCLFCERSMTPRDPSVIRAPFAATRRFSASFIRYAKR